LICKENGVQFPIKEFRYILQTFYRGDRLERTLNQEMDGTLFDEKFIIFEIDNIKEDAVLFPIVTLVIMDTFIQKMRLKSCRKMLVLEEAWKALATRTMAEFMKYLYKTVRKFNGIVGLVTQELSDVRSSEIVKDTIIANSEVLVLLDQAKYKENYADYISVLGLTEPDVNKIFTINRLDNKRGRPRFSEVFIRRGSHSDVYGIEVSPECYMAYTTERVEKEALKIYVRYCGGSYEKAIATFVRDMRRMRMGTMEFANIVNRQQKVMALWKKSA